MSAFWSFDNIARITGGDWLVSPHAAAERGSASEAAGTPAPGNTPHITGLWHDTRDLQPGQVYLAIQGETHDGHRFLDDAANKGASMAIISNPAAASPAAVGASPSAPTAGDTARPGPTGLRPRLPMLCVEDTVAALQDLASAYRDELARGASGGCKVIAVCGSNGKTTTRHLIHHVLTACGLTGTQSPKSFNNHLGVPLTLLAAQPTDDFVACELGTNHPGEIAALGEIAWPDVAVVTSIGREHLEFFKDLDGVAKEEASIMRFVRPRGFITMPAEAAALTAPYYDVQEGVTLLPVRDASDLPDLPMLPGEHNRMNAALVLALTRWLDLPPPPEVVQRALATATPPPGRLHILKLGQGVTLIDDTYNANPDSMLAALRTLATHPAHPAHPGGRRVAVLGEMRELGAASAQGHLDVARDASQLADQSILIGPAFDAPPWDDDTPALVAAQLHPGDTVLLKASRAMRLERIIPAIAQRFPPPPEVPPQSCDEPRDKSRR